MVFRHRLLFLSLLLLLILAPLAAADTCIFTSGADYTCYDGDTYTPPPPYTSFQEWCVENGGQHVSGPPSSRDECIEVCCCDNTDPYTPYSDWPISKLTCDSFGEPFFSFYEDPPSEDCVESCSGYTGEQHGPPADWNITGSVTDTHNSPLAGVRVWYVGGGNVYENYTDAAGKYELHHIPEGTHSFRAERTDCQPSEQQVDVYGNTQVDFVGDHALDCSSGLCTPDPVSSTTASINGPGDGRVTVTWTGTTCSPRGYQVVQRFKTPQGTFTGNLVLAFIPHTTTGAYSYIATPPTHPHVLYSYEVCYDIQVVPRNGRPINPERPDGDTHCVPVMSASCIEHYISPEEKQCFNNDPDFRPLIPPSPPTRFTGVGYCDEYNRAMSAEQCSAGSFCSVADGKPQCVSSTDCDACNSIFGFFFDPKELVNGEACGLKPTCALNKNRAQHAVDVLEPCSDISSCYDYRTADACTENHCGLETGCQWRTIPGLEEFGTGLCAPKAGKGQCERCADFGELCDAHLCSTYGTPDSPCYYNEHSTLTGVEQLGCLSKKNMACRYYDTRSDCVGARPNARDYDLVHDAKGTRISGTNHLNDPSEDFFNFSRCVWVSTDPDDPEQGYCIKDGDDWRPKNPLDAQVQDDCEERGRPVHACFADNNPPTTIVPLAPHSYVTFEQFRQTPISVIDGNTTLSPDHARFCLISTSATANGETCYPNQPFTNIVPLEEDEYLLRWYAEDDAGNLEEVRDMVLNIYQPSTAVLINATLVP